MSVPIKPLYVSENFIEEVLSRGKVTQEGGTQTTTRRTGFAGQNKAGVFVQLTIFDHLAKLDLQEQEKANEQSNALSQER